MCGHISVNYLFQFLWSVQSDKTRIVYTLHRIVVVLYINMYTIHMHIGRVSTYVCAHNTYWSVLASGKSPGVQTAFMYNLCWSVKSYKVSFIVFLRSNDGWWWRRKGRRSLLSTALYLSEKWRFFCIQKNNNNNNCICGFHLHPCIILHTYTHTHIHISIYLYYILSTIPYPSPPLSFLPRYRRPWFTAKFRSSI